MFDNSSESGKDGKSEPKRQASEEDYLKLKASLEAAQAEAATTAKENKTLRDGKKARDKEEELRATADAEKAEKKETRMEAMEAKLEEFAAENKVNKKELITLRGVVSRLPCPKSCTHEGCPLNHGGLTDQQEEAVKKQKKKEDDIREAKAQRALEARTKAKHIEEEARTSRIAALKLEIEREEEERLRGNSEPAGNDDTDATVSDNSTDGSVRDIRDVQGTRGESAGSDSKAEESAPPRTAQPAKEKATEHTEETKRIADVAAEDIIKVMAKDTPTRFSKRVQGQSSKNPKNKKNSATPPIPPLPNKLTTGAKAKPTTKSSSVLMLVEEPQ
jgi:hypothetical protein